MPNSAGPDGIAVGRGSDGSDVFGYGTPPSVEAKPTIAKEIVGQYPTGKPTALTWLIWCLM